MCVWQHLLRAADPFALKRYQYRFTRVKSYIDFPRLFNNTNNNNNDVCSVVFTFGAYYMRFKLIVTDSGEICTKKYSVKSA